jgi:hypothetical protein
MPSVGKPKLLDQVRDVIRRKHYSIRTEQAYIDWIRRFSLFHGKRHPRDMAEAEVSSFLTHEYLAHAKAVHERDLQLGFGSASSALCGSLFVCSRLSRWLQPNSRIA